MSKGIDLARFPSLAEIVSSPPDGWSDSDVPLAQRGVRLSWLVGMVRNLLEDINRVPPYAMLNVRSVVDHFVLPLTVALRAPLWAYVPEEHRGVPDCFVSHRWDCLLFGPPEQEIGTLDAIEHLKNYVWIDFVAYNQHTIESVPTDMEAVIGEIGKVVFAGTPVPTLGRIWCLWELLCANRTGTDFDIAIRPGFRNDKILAVNTFYRSFVGVENAIATKQKDREVISDEVLSQFGSPEAANEHLDRALREQLSGSWYELRERDEPLGFRPWPWLAELANPDLAKLPVREFQPYYGAGLRDTVVYGSQQSTLDMLIEAGLQTSQPEAIADLSLKFLKTAALDGDLDQVRMLLQMGTDPDRLIGPGSVLSYAAGYGQVPVVELLLDSGADIEGGAGLSPLGCAARKGQDEVVRLLIGQGADIEADTGGTALFLASLEGQLSTVRLLLQFGADVDAKTENRLTPLLAAAAKGHLDVVVQLIDSGAGLDCTDPRGDTALHYAAYNGSAAIVEALVQAGAERAVANKDGDTAYKLGEQAGKLDAVTLDLLRL